MKGICNQLLISLLCLMPSASLLAQEPEPLLLQVSYEQKGKKTLEQEGYIVAEMVLEIGPTRRGYFDRWDMRLQIMADSIFAAGGGTGEYMSARASMPHPKWKGTVFTNYPEAGQLLGTDQVFRRHYYIEPIETPEWRLLSDTTTILGYACRAAECDFRGRTWHVWYAPDIAVDAGPWKLHGLPGLILRAEDSKRDFSMECIGLTKGAEGEMLTDPYLKKYIKTTRKEIQEGKTALEKDRVAFLKSQGVQYPQGWGPDGKPLKYPSHTAIFMDY